MYSGKYKIWGIVFAIFIVGCIVKSVINSTPEKDTSEIKSATMASDNKYIAWYLDGKKLNCGTKIHSSNSVWDLYLTESEPLDGYDYEEYVSPIVAVMCYTYQNNQIMAKHDDVYSLDLIRIMNASIEEKRFVDEWANTVNYSYRDDVIRVAVDVNYEKEIKQTMLMQLAQTSSISEDIYDAYINKVNDLWNALPKTSDPYAYIEENSDYIVITAEYHASNRSAYIGSITPSVGVKLYLNYKEGYGGIAADDKIMKYTCMRRKSYSGVYKKGRMKGADWTTIIVDLNERFKSPNAVKTEDEVNQAGFKEANTEDLENTQNVLNDKSADNKADYPMTPTTVLNPSIQDTDENQDEKPETQPPSDAGWDINTKTDSHVEADRNINPNAYGVQN